MEVCVLPTVAIFTRIVYGATQISSRLDLVVCTSWQSGRIYLIMYFVLVQRAPSYDYATIHHGARLEKRKKNVHTRVGEFWNAYPLSTASPFGRINLKPSQSTASKSRSPHSVRVRVGLGWSVSGSTPNPPLNIYQYVYMYLVLYTWNQVFTYIIIVVVLIVHLIVGAFQTRAPGCASNNVTWKSIHFSIYSFVFFAYRIMHGTGDALWNHSSK